MRVRLRQSTRVLGPSFSTVRRALESGVFSTAELDPGAPGSPGLWTVEAGELARWLAGRATPDATLSGILADAYESELVRRFKV